MANIVKFKINGLSSALYNVYTRVTDLSRNELYSGETLVSDVSGNVELDIGTAGSNGQGVIVYGDNYSVGNELTFKSFTGYGVVERLLANVMSGTQLFLLDSLTAGPGSIVSVPYTVANLAETDGRLRNLWVRPILATAATTDTTIGVSSGTVTNGSSLYTPSSLVLDVDGTIPTEQVTLVTRTFGWSKCKIYFLKSSTGGTFTITEPVNQVVSVNGSDNEIGFVEIVNPNGKDLTPIKISNFTSPVKIAGYLYNVNDISTDYLDVINFAKSGQNTAGYNECLNIVDWYNLMGVTGAVINSGTNDASFGYTATLAQFKIMLDRLLSIPSMAGQDVLLIRPNDNAKILGDLWEDARDYANTRFASIVRIYGNLATFQANSWMAEGDNVHPNDTFNAIQGTEEYNLNLANLSDAIDLGTEPHWITEMSTTTYAALSSPAPVSGDFTISARVYWNGDRNNYIYSSTTDTNWLMINADGRVQVRVNGSTYSSAVGAAVAGWHTLSVNRIGASMTVKLDEVTVITSTVSTSDISFQWFGRWPYGYSINGKIAWVSVDTRHLWLFDQAHEESVIQDLVGTSNASWLNRLLSGNNPVKYSIMSNGTLLDYHYNLPTTMVWGSENWPS